MDSIVFQYGTLRYLRDKETREMILLVNLDRTNCGRDQFIIKLDTNFDDRDIPQEKLDVSMGTDLETRLLSKVGDPRIERNNEGV